MMHYDALRKTERQKDKKKETRNDKREKEGMTKRQIDKKKER